jgi:transcriptional regulator with XRE-family HTH domain
MGENLFGQYIRQRRVEAELSLRFVADQLGISHVYLGEVERGVRPPLKKEHWAKLIATIPDIIEQELERKAAKSRPVQLNLEDAPPRYQDLGLALARRIEKRDLDEHQLTELLRLLAGREDE